MVYEPGETLPQRISDDDLIWVVLNEWQVAYLSQASDDQREIVYREAIRMAMDSTGAIPGLGI
jgi:hypothetical protein